MSKHPHKEGFVPKDLLKKLAKEGNEEAKKTLKQIESITQNKTDSIRKKSSVCNSMILISVIVISKPLFH